MNLIKRLSFLILGLGTPLATWAQTPVTSPAAAAGDEIPPMFQASEVLDPALLGGPHHRVRELAPCDGFLIHFTIDSDFGVYECVGIREVKLRVIEIHAIARLVEVSKGDLFAQGLKQSIDAPIEAVKNIVDHPGKSVRQVPKTVGRMIGKIGSAIGDAAERAKEGRESGEERTPREVGKEIGTTFKNVAGFDKTKRQCALELGVDPYSDNDRLQEEMEKVSWAFFAGGLPLKVAAASTGAALALSATEVVGLPGEVYAATAAELEEGDRVKLLAIGVPEDRVVAVMRSTAISVSLRHAMIEALGQLKGPGRAEIVDLMIASENPWQARFLLGGLQLLVIRNRADAYVDCGVLGTLVAGEAGTGVLEVVAPVDYFGWTAETAAFAKSPELADAGKRRLVTTGQVSQKAAEGLGSAGWEVVRVKRP